MIPLIYENVGRGRYFIEEDGRIYSQYKKGYMSPSEDKDGYLRLKLYGQTTKEKYYLRIATLVIHHFVGVPPKTMKDPTVNHIDNNKKNNHFTNLEWLERGINSSIRGKQKSAQGVKNGSI